MNFQAGVGLRSNSTCRGFHQGRSTATPDSPVSRYFFAHVGNNPHPGARFRNHRHQIAENFREAGTSVVAHRLPYAFT